MYILHTVGKTPKQLCEVCRLRRIRMYYCILWILWILWHLIVWCGPVGSHVLLYRGVLKVCIIIHNRSSGWSGLLPRGEIFWYVAPIIIWVIPLWEKISLSLQELFSYGHCCAPHYLKFKAKGMKSEAFMAAKRRFPVSASLFFAMDLMRF